MVDTEEVAAEPRFVGSKALSRTVRDYEKTFTLLIAFLRSICSYLRIPTNQVTGLPEGRLCRWRGTI